MEITHPLQQYKLEFKDKFREVAEKTFDELAKDSNVDVEANRSLCDEINGLKSDTGDVKRSLTWTTVACVTLWIIAVGSIIYSIFGQPDSAILAALLVAAGISLLVLFAKIHPRIKALKGQRDELQALIDQKVSEAWQQMEPLNRLFDWDMFYRMFSETIPMVTLDDFVPEVRMSQLRAHGMNCDFGDDTSVLCVHSGTINGNPFAICRTRTMVWGSMTYSGSKTIHWTTRERGADGKYETRHHSQTLTATVTAPYPEYPEVTKLVYGHSAAPGLTFHRTKNMFDYKQGGLLYGIKKMNLERKSRKLSSDYAMDTNEEFEVTFTASDRNDSQQFFLLFTPMAQQSMVALIQDKEDAYGDDFEFEKMGEINTITADHMQSIALDLNPDYFRQYDFDRARDNFIKLNCDFFRAIYFNLAPILSIPLYQDAPQGYMTQTVKATESISSEWEHESLANFWGESEFSNPSSERPNILKTEVHRHHDGESTVDVTAYSYASNERLTYVKKYGGDGRWHNVPVYWREYYPVTGTGSFTIQEQPSEPSNPTPSDRYRKSIELIRRMGRGGILRRMIWSALNSR